MYLGYINSDNHLYEFVKSFNIIIEDDSGELNLKPCSNGHTIEMNANCHVHNFAKATKQITYSNNQFNLKIDLIEHIQALKRHNN